MSKRITSSDVKLLMQKRDELIKELGQTSPFINGSIVKKYMTCGNKDHCKCSQGKKHVGHYLMYTEDNKPKTAYVPKDLVNEVGNWSKQYKILKQIIKQICKYQRLIMKNYRKG